MLPPTLWRLFVLIWLLFLYYPLLNLVQAPPALVPLLLTVAGAILFATLYLALALPLPFAGAIPFRSALRAHLPTLALAALLVTDILLLTLFAGAVWLWFLMFAGIAVGARLPSRLAAAAVAVIAALTVTLGVGAFGWVYALRIALPVAVVGFAVIGVGRLLATIRALRAAREEIARLAVAEERLRFARDLHDLLGHSLSAITLKNEVARSLVPTHPDRAVRELAEAIGLAREALREVRQAVSGYRQPDLAAEIRGARAVLEAAGIAGTFDVDADLRPPPSALEAVLAWTVREGVTNVVRHSGAQRCTVAIRLHAEVVAAEIADDGPGSGAPPSPQPDIPGRAGSGLRGLAERAAQLHGWVEAGPREPAGFCLRVTVPLAPRALPTGSTDGAVTNPTDKSATAP